MMVFSVYGKRRKNSENTGGRAYGYSTWWLTYDRIMEKNTRDLAERYGESCFMRPEFLLKHVSLCPSPDQATLTLKKILPSRLGLQLSNRMEPQILREITARVNEYSKLQPGRVKAKVETMVDQLKRDSRLRKKDSIYAYRDWETDRKSTRLNSSHEIPSRMPSSA